jgi:hypothetical protein
VGDFAKWAEQVMALDPEEKQLRPKVKHWRERSSEQVNKLREHMPLMAEEGQANATETLKQLSAMIYGLGYKFRMQRHMDQPEETTSLLPRDDPGIPGRDISISLPKAAAWVEPRLFSKQAVGPLRAMLQNTKVEAEARLKERKSKSFASTDNPMTVPGFAPMAAIAVPESFRKGFTQADADAAEVRNELLSAELEQAKQEFEQALGEEYQGRKAASAGEWLDLLADRAVKQAESEQGTGQKWLNSYLAAAALLGYGSHRAAENFVSKRDPARQKHKMYRMALRQRMHDKGVPVMVDFNEMPASRVEEDLLTELPIQEAKEAAIASQIGAVGKASPAASSVFRDLLERFKPLVTAKTKIGLKTGRRYRPSAWGLPNIATLDQMELFKQMSARERMRISHEVLGKTSALLQKKAAKPKLLGMEGLDSGQVADFNMTGKLPSAPAPAPVSTSEPSTNAYPPSGAARDVAVDRSMGTVQEPRVVDRSGASQPVNTASPYNPRVHGKDYMAPYKMPEGYTPPAGSRMADAWKAIGDNRANLGFQPGSAEYAQNAREHAYEGEQVYQSLRAQNDKTYQEMANKGWISPTKNEGVYASEQKEMRNRRDRAEMEARAARAAQGVREKGPQGQWEDYQARGGWKQEYPKGTNFNIDVNDPRTQTPGMRRNIALGKIDKGRAQSAGALLNKVQSGQFNPGTSRVQQAQTTRANVLTSMGRGSGKR